MEKTLMIYKLSMVIMTRLLMLLKKMVGRKSDRKDGRWEGKAFS